jgi:hypothetical protein
MKRGPKLTPAVMVIRMKGLPRRHRIAHLRALIARQPVRSVHREELAALLRDELTAQLGTAQYESPLDAFLCRRLFRHTRRALHRHQPRALGLCRQADGVTRFKFHYSTEVIGRGTGKTQQAA